MIDKNLEELKAIKQFAGMQVQIAKHMLLELKAIRYLFEKLEKGGVKSGDNWWSRFRNSTIRKTS